MTQLQHIAWYNLVIANVYAAAEKGWVPMAIFCFLAVISFGASYFEGQR